MDSSFASETPGQSTAHQDAEHTSVPSVEELHRTLKLDGKGLLPAVVQDDTSGEVLMLGWMDPEALHRTLTTGRAWYFSRSRQEYWRKGDTSGHTQHVVSVALDCDKDTVLLRVHQNGPACHTGTTTCFSNRQLPTA